jgi:hypothetical protein
VKHSDTGGGEMTDQQLDQLLAAANSELLEHIEAAASTGNVLSTIMSRQDRPVGPGGLPASHDPGRLPAAATISLRIRARALDDRLRNFLKAEGILDRYAARSLIQRSTGEPDSARGLVRGLYDALDDALDLADLLDQYYFRKGDRYPDSDLADARGRARELAGELIRVVDSDLARALTRTLADDLPEVRAGPRADIISQALDDLARRKLSYNSGDFARALTDALTSARALTDALDALQVDASDTDLSDLEIRQLDPLDGVIWTRGTAWPANIAAQVKAHSEEIRPGVYQVRLGNTRDRGPLARV